MQGTPVRRTRSALRDRDALDRDRLQRPVVAVGRRPRDPVQRVLALEQLAEDRVVRRERVVGVQHEELAAVRVGARVGHGQGAALVAASYGLVLEALPWAAPAGA